MRRKFLINPKFQLTFIAFMLVIGLIVSCIFLVSNLYFFWKFHQLGQGLHLSPDHVFYVFLKQQEIFMLKIFGIAVSVIFLTTIVAGIFFSHRIAGPLYKFHQHLKEAANSDRLHEVRFRKGDFFQELAEAYNKQLRK